MKKSKCFISSFLILGGIGSIFLGVFPIVSIIFIILGILGALLSYLNSQSRDQELDYIIDAQATLFAQHGIGNIYSQAFKNEILKTGSTQNGYRLLEKALNVDPYDQDALSLLSSSISLQLSYERWLGVDKKSKYFKSNFSYAKKLALRGHKKYPDNHTFYDTLGVLCDTVNEHEKARKYFNRSGKLRKDPYWRLLLATSWQMVNEHEKAILELTKAKKQDAKGWLINFYLGRALNSVGDHVEAWKYLKIAFEERGARAELLWEISQSYYLRGCFFKAAKYVLRLSLSIIGSYWICGIKYLFQAAAYIGIGLACYSGKQLWKIKRHIPILRRLKPIFFSPDEPEFTLGNLLLQKGNYKEAEKNFRACCTIIPNKAESHTNLALCLAIQGLKEEAIIECDKAIELNPKNELLIYSKKQIEDGEIKRIRDQNGKVIKKV